MTETTGPEAAAPSSDGSRALVEYVGPADADEGNTEQVSLPGYLDALPSIVAPGDTFTCLAEHAAELDAQAEFEVAGLLPADHPEFTATVREIAGDSYVEPAVPADLAKADAKRAEAASKAEGPAPVPVAPSSPPTPPATPPGGSAVPPDATGGPDPKGSNA